MDDPIERPKSLQFEQKVSKRIHGYGVTIPKKMFEGSDYDVGEDVLVTIIKEWDEHIFGSKVQENKSKQRDGKIYSSFYVHIRKHLIDSGSIQHKDQVRVKIEKSLRRHDK